MRKISFDVNNGGKLNICQAKHDGSVSISTGDNKGYNISAGGFAMLLNFYKYVKDNNIQNDFINYYGKTNHRRECQPDRYRRRFSLQGIILKYGGIFV